MIFSNNLLSTSNIIPFYVSHSSKETYLEAWLGVFQEEFLVAFATWLVKNEESNLYLIYNYSLFYFTKVDGSWYEFPLLFRIFSLTGLHD